MICLACFDEHSHRFNSETHESSNRRVLGKRSISTLGANRELKKHSSDWVPANERDNKFKDITWKEQEVLSAAGMRGKKCIRLTGFNKEKLSNEIIMMEIKGLGLAQDLNPNSNARG